MNNWQNALVVQAHHEALHKAAEQARLAQEAQDNKHQNPALAALGRLLVEAGSRLQENYGEVGEELKVERQHA